jgi:hypothetical protein
MCGWYGTTETQWIPYDKTMYNNDIVIEYLVKNKLDSIIPRVQKRKYEEKNKKAIKKLKLVRFKAGTKES